MVRLFFISYVRFILLEYICYYFKQRHICFDGVPVSFLFFLERKEQSFFIEK